jgi:hypothetical protein
MAGNPGPAAAASLDATPAAPSPPSPAPIDAARLATRDGATPAPPDAGVPDVSAAPPLPPVSTGAAMAIDTIYVITLGDADWAKVKGSASAPFINGQLLPRFAHAENCHTPWHPALPNYSALEAGDSLFGITPKRVLDPVHRTPSKDHLTSLVSRSGRAWRFWYGALPGGGATCPLVDSAPGWDSNDAAILFFDDVTGAPPSPQNPTCIEHLRPLPELWPALETGKEAAFNMIVGGRVERGAACPADAPRCDRVRAADSYLSELVPRLLAGSPAYRRGSAAVFVLWVEPARGPLLEDNREPAFGLLAISPKARPGFASTTLFSHASLVKTIERAFDLRPLLRQAATATTNDLADLFHSFP